jgi:UDPglucose 6-dehydrogenase
VDKINLRRRERVVDLVREEAGGLDGVRVAVLGLAFKPHSDDIRDSPALDIAIRLAEGGAVVTATDPEAVPNARRRAPQLNYVGSAAEAAADADIVVLITEWPEFTALDPQELGVLVTQRVVIDGRNALDADRWRAAGWRFRGLGR